MSDVAALTVHIIQVKDNFIHLHSKFLDKFKNSKNTTGCIKIKSNQAVNYASCFATPFNVNGENAFNVSSSFAKTLKVDEFDIVIVSNAEYVRSLKTVHVSPASAEDLQILENSFDTVQSVLLNQIRVVRLHQILNIWIMKSFSLKVHIDQLDHALVYGKLEQYSEVIVSLDPNECRNCNFTEDEEGRQDFSTVSNPWNFFKNIFASNPGTLNEIRSKLESNTKEIEFINGGIFRCALKYDKLLPNINYYPYTVFISRKHCPIVNYFNEEGYSICRLTYLSYNSTKLSKTQILERNDDTSKNVLSETIFVQLYIVEDTSHHDYFRMINSYPTIFISKAVFYSLRLKINSKVKLDFVKNEEKLKLTQLDFTVIKSENTDEELIEKARLFFASCLNATNKVIVNNNCLFTFDYASKEVLYITFNPVTLPFVELSKQNLDSCNFRVTKRRVEIHIDEDTADKRNELMLIDFSFQRDIIRMLKSSLFVNLRLRRIPMDDDMENCNHTILEGDIGTGKSCIVDKLAEEFSKFIFVKKLECKALKGKLISKLENLIKSALIECVFYQPAILCLDDLDVLFTSSKQNIQQQSEPSVSSYTNRLSHMISDLLRCYLTNHITILATARSSTNFEAALYNARGSSVFSSIISIPILNQDKREECFVKFLSSKINRTYDMENLRDVIQRTEGYCVQDIYDLVDRIYFEILKRQAQLHADPALMEIQQADVEEALSNVTPLALVGIDLYKNTSVTWNDVGGLEGAKQILTEVLIWPSQFPKIFSQCPLKMQSGVLLYGAPGSGKTLLASAVAGESGLNFVSIKGPELLSKFVGESEEGVRNIFRKAQNAKPCILFFDEFDSLAPRRGNDITGATDRVVNQLLTELDGVEAVSGVWVLAATSRPDLIDPALVRPGRLGTTVYCPLPNQNERRSIFEVLSSTVQLLEDVDFNEAAKMTEGLTGADLKSVLYTAAMKCDTTRLQKVKACLREKDEAAQLANGEKANPKIDTNCLLEAVRETKPSLKLEERIAYEKIYRVFQQKDENFKLPLDQRLTYA